MEEDPYRDAANGIINAIADRERTDIRLPPSLISLVILAYLSVSIYYITSVYSVYDTIPIHQMFTVVALFTIGAALIIAIMLSLTSRNGRHAKREGRLRGSLIEYCEANNHVCGYDLDADIGRLKQKDEEIREMDAECRRPSVILISAPIVLSLVLVSIPDLSDSMVAIMAVCYGISLCISLFFTPGITTFPRRHERKSKEFYDILDGVSAFIGIDTGTYEETMGYRSFWVFILFSVLSCGLFIVYWCYLMFKDMNRHFDMQWSYEDRIFRSLRDRELGIKYRGRKRGKDYTLEEMWAGDDSESIRDGVGDPSTDDLDECI